MSRYLLLLCLASVCIGCASSSTDHLNAEETKRAENVNALAKVSGGDWNKLTAEQQQAMIKATGSEGTARQVLQMKAHPPNAVSHGKPAAPGP